MSLKAFHVFFVVVSVLLCVGLGLWALRDFVARGEVLSLVIGVGTLLGAVVLVVCGVWFTRKLKHVSYL